MDLEQEAVVKVKQEQQQEEEEEEREDRGRGSGSTVWFQESPDTLEELATAATAAAARH